ncbi:WD repeat-containing protein 46 isoform X4 [Leptonychotes weddellii]|uniref:WD repeat-containing protein 46 isoform X4 n=1 Tax=Leptonychotes weddellii TaxID=9713 RepID=A0A7F8R7K3_LEPWE|nr:WD repeat-containing protein 46 isoform X4 [Leptonychotes weddellii]
METAPKPGRDVPPKKDRLQTKKKKPRRYWEEETTLTAAGASPGPPGSKKRNRELRPERPKNANITKKSRISRKPHLPKKPRERRNLEPQRSVSGAQDPFPGPAPVPVEVARKFRRIDKSKKLPHSKSKTRSRLEVAEAEEEEISIKAARSELLLAEEPGFLHSEALLAVAQNRWLHIYDNQGIELHCIRRCDRVTRLEFLPFHFLLATASETGFLTYLDVSVGKIVAALNARAGRLDVMTKNPYNAVIHLGHSNGIVSLWSPAMKEPLAKILCHRGGVRAVAVDSTGTYMATSGLDHQLKIFDLRGTFQPLSARTLPQGAGHLAFSQRGLLAAGMGDVVNIWAGQGKASPPSLEQPYLTHRLSGHVHGLHFCPFEDVLGVGHNGGITSMLVPGAAEPNFDGLESNPYRSQKQRQEWEVKALLEKVPAELICLDPRALAEVDVISLEQEKKERIERLGYDPEAKAPFQPKPKQKGRSSTASLVKRKRKVMDEEHRDKVRQSLEQQPQKKEKAAKPLRARPSALDRFVR